MADNPINRQTRAGPTDRSPASVGAEGSKTIKVTETGKPTEVGTAKEPTISRTPGGVPIGEISQTAALDPYHPVLIASSINLSAEESDKTQANLRKKFTEPISAETLDSIINSGAEELIKQHNILGDKIAKINNSNKSVDYKMMQIQQLLIESMQTSMNISGEYSKFIANQQEEARKEAEKAQAEKSKAWGNLSIAQKIGRIFGFIGDLINIVAAAFAGAAALAATTVTGGAAAALLLGTSMWFTAALGSLCFRVYQEGAPTSMQPTAENAMALNLMFMIASIGGMVLTAGATSYLAGAQTLVASCETVNTTATTLQQAGSAIILGQTGGGAVLQAAKEAQTATQALLDAIRAGGAITQDISQAAIKATEVLEKVMKGAAQLPPSVSLETFSKAAETLTKSANSFVAANTSKIQDIADLSIRVKSILGTQQSASTFVTLSAEQIVLPIVNQVFKSQVSIADIKKTEKEMEIDQIRYMLENNTNMIKNILKAFTDLSKDLSSYLKESSRLSHSILRKI